MIALLLLALATAQMDAPAAAPPTGLPSASAPTSVSPAPVPHVPAARVDPHIRYIDYDPDAVVHLTGYTGYQTIVEFGPDERIETVGIGDASGWQVTPNGAATVMFLKPIGVARATNLSIVTNLRRYNLELVAKSGARVPDSATVYAVRFRYAAKPAPATAEPLPTTPPVVAEAARNVAYSYAGSALNVPDQVFDDGKATYFRFVAGKPTPAIFAVTDRSGETIVNAVQRGPFFVVDQVAPQFVLRQGPEVTQLFNDGFHLPAPGAEAPKARPSQKRGLFGIGRRKDP